jgi:LysM repeat protein
MKLIILMLLAPWASAATAAEATRHTVEPQDCLWDLAESYYGDAFRWGEIAAANPEVKDPHRIYPGQVLIIPASAAVAAAPIPQPQAQPVEASAAVEAPEPSLPEAKAEVEAAAPVEIAAIEAPPTPIAAEKLAREPMENESNMSTKIRGTMGGQYPSFTRLEAPKGWKEDGRVTEFKEQEIVSGPGDMIEARLKREVAVSPGERLYVLREDAPEEGDADPKALHLQRVGIVEVREVLGKENIRCRVLKAGGAVELGDYLSRNPL